MGWWDEDTCLDLVLKILPAIQLDKVSLERNANGCEMTTEYLDMHRYRCLDMMKWIVPNSTRGINSSYIGYLTFFSQLRRSVAGTMSVTGRSATSISPISHFERKTCPGWSISRWHPAFPGGSKGAPLLRSQKRYRTRSASRQFWRLESLPAGVTTGSKVFFTTQEPNQPRTRCVSP